MTDVTVCGVNSPYQDWVPIQERTKGLVVRPTPFEFKGFDTKLAISFSVHKV